MEILVILCNIVKFIDLFLWNHWQKSFIYHGLLFFFSMKQVFCYKSECDDHSATWYFYYANELTNAVNPTQQTFYSDEIEIMGVSVWGTCPDRFCRFSDADQCTGDLYCLQEHLQLCFGIGNGELGQHILLLHCLFVSTSFKSFQYTDLYVYKLVFLEIWHGLSWLNFFKIKTSLHWKHVSFSMRYLRQWYW